MSLEPFANSHGYRLNREHLLASAIIDMAAAHVDLTEKLKGTGRRVGDPAGGRLAARLHRSR